MCISNVWGTNILLKKRVLILLLSLILLKGEDKDLCGSEEAFGFVALVRALLDESSWNTPHCWKTCHGANLQISLVYRMARAICMKHRCFCCGISSSSLILGRNAAIMLYWPKFPQKKEPNPWTLHERLCHIFLLISITLVESGCWWNLDSSPLHCPESWALSHDVCPSLWSCANRAQDQLQNNSLEHQWLIMMNSPSPSSHIPFLAFSKHPKKWGRCDLPFWVLC